MMFPPSSAEAYNRLLVADTQQQEAASRRVLRAGQRRRYASRTLVFQRTREQVSEVRDL